MTFKIGDMVRIVQPQGPVESPYDAIAELAGKAGTIVAFHGIDGWIVGKCWKLTLADGRRAWVAESCLRLIPGDSEGRKLVEFNWRDLLSKTPQERPHLSQVRLPKTEIVQS